MQAKLTDSNYVHKPAADLMRWWQKKDALRKQAAAEQGIQSTREMMKALMAWEDHGGPPTQLSSRDVMAASPGHRKEGEKRTMKDNNELSITTNQRIFTRK